MDSRVECIDPVVSGQRQFNLSYPEQAQRSTGDQLNESNTAFHERHSVRIFRPQPLTKTHDHVRPICPDHSSEHPDEAPEVKQTERHNAFKTSPAVRNAIAVQVAVCFIENPPPWPP